MKLVSPLSFYKVWCLDDFSSQFRLAKLIAASEKYWFQGLFMRVVEKKGSKETSVPEFANHVAGERAAMWHALGVTRALWHHDSTCFSGIQRKIAFTWAWLAFHAKGACGHLFLPFILNLQFALWLPASSHSWAKFHKISIPHYHYNILPTSTTCSACFVTSWSPGVLWERFDYRLDIVLGIVLRGLHLCKSHARETEWIACCGLPKARPGSNTRYCMEVSLLHARTACE